MFWVKSKMFSLQKKFGPKFCKKDLSMRNILDQKCYGISRTNSSEPALIAKQHFNSKIFQDKFQN